MAVVMTIGFDRQLMSQGVITIAPAISAIAPPIAH